MNRLVFIIDKFIYLCYYKYSILKKEERMKEILIKLLKSIWLKTVIISFLGMILIPFVAMFLIFNPLIFVFAITCWLISSLVFVISWGVPVVLSGY